MRKQDDELSSSFNPSRDSNLARYGNAGRLEGRGAGWGFFKKGEDDELSRP